jgi:SOS response associated peptidase (SRAP)
VAPSPRGPPPWPLRAAYRPPRRRQVARRRNFRGRGGPVGRRSAPPALPVARRLQPPCQPRPQDDQGGERGARPVRGAQQGRGGSSAGRGAVTRARLVASPPPGRPGRSTRDRVRPLHPHRRPAAGRLALRGATRAGRRTAPRSTPGYPIAPTRAAVTVTDDGTRHLEQMRRGLVPRWAKAPTMGSRLLNARAEALAEKPASRDALRAAAPASQQTGSSRGRPSPAGRRSRRGTSARRAARPSPSPACGTSGRPRRGAILRAAARASPPSPTR